MSIREKRRKPRSSEGIGESVFIEIRHTFGPVRKSVYKVLELDEFGLSFLMPKEDGHFATDTPLQYAIVREDMSRTQGSGLVRYHHPHSDESGRTYYRTGIEVSNSYRNVPTGAYSLRPRRYHLDGKNYERSITFSADGDEWSFELIDISRYGAAFHCAQDDLSLLRISTVLPAAELSVGSKLIYQGPVTVTRIYHDMKGLRRVVVEPRNKVFDIDSIEQYESINSAAQESRALIRRHAQYDAIDRDFKAATADLRCFLEDYKRYLESPRFQSGEAQEEELLQELFDGFYGKMDQKVTALDDILRSLHLSEQDEALYKAYYQKHLLSLLLTAPVNHRSYFKPEGYPGDYEIIRMLHRNAFEGPTLFGKILNKYTATIPLAAVARKRTEYLAGRILGHVAQSSGEQVEVFSIASGPALEIEHLIMNEPLAAKRISLRLLDQEINALRFSQDNLYERKIQFDSAISLEFVHQKLSDYLRQSASPTRDTSFDFVYAFGLFDYFDRDMARFIIKCLMPQIKPSGRLLISNISLDNNRYRSFIEYGLDWYVVYRSRDQLAALVTDNSTCASFSVDEIEDGMMKFLEIRR